MAMARLDKKRRTLRFIVDVVTAFARGRDISPTTRGLRSGLPQNAVLLARKRAA
jgi:hypothetical protein